MRLLLLVSAVSLFGGGAFAQSLLGQSQPGGGRSLPTVAVPDSAPIVAAPAGPVPVASSPARSSQPPGLVQTPMPPSDVVQQSPPPQTPADETKVAQNSQAVIRPVPTQAVSPSAPMAAASVQEPGAATLASLPPNDVPPAPDNKWIYGHTVELGVLNKVEGTTETLTIPVGGQAVSGDLTVSVQACVVRPPGELPNTAVFLTLQSTNTPASAPVYRGWIVKSLPGSSNPENADEAFRVIDCS